MDDKTLSSYNRIKKVHHDEFARKEKSLPTLTSEGTMPSSYYLLLFVTQLSREHLTRVLSGVSQTQRWIAGL